jgi:hypothetical protein
MREVNITYAATSRIGLFEKPNEHYGEVWYELRGKREMSRSATEPIVLESIYALAGRQPPAPVDVPPYPGYPLAAQPAAAPWVFFVAWPLVVIAIWWWVRRPRILRLRTAIAGDR